MANGISVDQHSAAVIRGSPKAGCSNAGAAAGIAYSSKTSCFET
jgi:hypothetical protein